MSFGLRWPVGGGQRLPKYAIWVPSGDQIGWLTCRHGEMLVDEAQLVAATNARRTTATTRTRRNTLPGYGAHLMTHDPEATGVTAILRRPNRRLTPTRDLPSAHLFSHR